MYSIGDYFNFRRVSELENILQNTDESAKSQVEASTAKLHEKTSEAASLKLENERLKVGHNLQTTCLCILCTMYY